MRTLGHVRSVLFVAVMALALALVVALLVWAGRTGWR
jgi:flagellar biosynthesis/type III secretory pathway M-ring protein FliF/YscJ